MTDQTENTITDPALVAALLLAGHKVERIAYEGETWVDFEYPSEAAQFVSDWFARKSAVRAQMDLYRLVMDSLKGRVGWKEVQGEAEVLRERLGLA